MSIYEPYLFTLNNGKVLVDLIRHYSHHNLNHVKKIVNVFQPYYKNKKGNGLGDYIRGCYFLYQYCKIADKECEMNMRYHLISNMLENEYSEFEPDIQHAIQICEHHNYQQYLPTRDKEHIIHYITHLQLIHSYFSKCYIDNQQTMYVYINCYPLFTIHDDDRLFIKNSFTPSYMIDNMVSSMLEQYQLEAHSYHIIHIRCGDLSLIYHKEIPHKLFLKIVSAIKKCMNSQKKYILISDSDRLKKMIVFHLPELIVYEYTITHISEGVEQQYDGIMGTLIDYTLLLGALSIDSITTYEHGTGFSKWCAETYHIPYTCTFLQMNS